MRNMLFLVLKKNKNEGRRKCVRVFRDARSIFGGRSRYVQQGCFQGREVGLVNSRKGICFVRYVFLYFLNFVFYVSVIKLIYFLEKEEYFYLVFCLDRGVRFIVNSFWSVYLLGCWGFYRYYIQYFGSSCKIIFKILSLFFESLISI